MRSTSVACWRTAVEYVLRAAAVGTFTKALDLRQLWPQCLALFGFFLGFTGLSLIMLKKQEA